MIKLNLKDPAIRALIIESLLEQVDNDRNTLLRQGAGLEWIDTLRTMSSRDAVRASHLQHVAIEVTLNENQLFHAFTQVADERRVRQLLEYFVRHGASIPMLCKMFKISSKEAKATKQLLIANQRLGRPPMPDLLHREEIHAQWDSIIKADRTVPLREQIYLLHQRFPSHTLATLWLVINEFDSYSAGKLANQNPNLSTSLTKWVGGSCVHKLDSEPRSTTSSIS